MQRADLAAAHCGESGTGSRRATGEPASGNDCCNLEDDGIVPAHHEPVSAVPSAERGMVVREELDAVWRAVDQLSARQKEVFVLRFAEDMELKEIAEVLGLSTGTVKTQLFRAVTSVRQQVGR